MPNWSKRDIPGFIIAQQGWKVRLAPNGTNPGLFQIRFQYIWLDRVKCTENWFEKVPDLSNLRFNLTHFGAKLTTPDGVWWGKVNDARRNNCWIGLGHDKPGCNNQDIILTYRTMWRNNRYFLFKYLVGLRLDPWWGSAIRALIANDSRSWIVEYFYT